MAYNILDAVKIDCPVCEIRSTHQLQITTAASHLHGPDGGSLSCRSYKFGDRLAWWPRSDPRYAEWRESGSSESGSDAAEEWLPLTCPSCLSKLLVLIGFESLYIVGVIDVVQAS